MPNKIDDSLIEKLVQTNIALDKKSVELMEAMHLLTKKIAWREIMEIKNYGL